MGLSRTITLFLVAFAVALVSASSDESLTPARARCVISIKGQLSGEPFVRADAKRKSDKQAAAGPGINLKNASIHCVDGPVTIAVNEKLLGSNTGVFISDSVTLNQKCEMPGCLLTVCGDTRAIIENSTIEGVEGVSVLLCIRDEADVVLNRTSISGNDASAVVAFNRSKLVVVGSSVSHNMVMHDRPARQGGETVRVFAVGVSAVDTAYVVIADRSSVGVNLWAVPEGYYYGDIRYSPINYDNGQQGWWNGASGVMVRDAARMEMVGATVSYNWAEGDCGGVLVAGMGRLNVTGGSHIDHNVASVHGGGLCVRDNATLILEGNSTVESNKCGVLGCGILVDGKGDASVQGSVKISGNVALPLSPSSTGRCDRVCLYQRDFRNAPAGGSGLAVGYAGTLLLDGPVQIANNMGHAAYAFGNATLFVQNGVSFSASAGPTANDALLATANNAVLSLGEGVVCDGKPLTVCSSSVLLGSSMCPPGSFSTPSRSCTCCPAYSYDFSTSTSPRAKCYQCPDNAECVDNRIVPKAGFWHSSAKSSQVHKCPLNTSCAANDTCVDGYQGALCGMCAEGYGMIVPFKCGKCWDRRKQSLVYLALFCVSVALMTYTVHATWQDNKTGGKALRVSDLIKVPVQFLQYLVILGSITAPWPGFLVSCFTAAAVVFQAAGGQSSLDCWVKQHLSHLGPVSITRQLVLFIAPIVALAAVMLLIVVSHMIKVLWSAAESKGKQNQRAAPALHLLSRIRVAMLVVAFYAYPTLAKASLSFFACLRIDRKTGKDVPPYPEYAVMNHTQGYWASDISQECFVGWHTKWAFGLGVPAVFAVCLGVPIAIWWFMRCNKDRAADPGFQEHYGFLYRNYREGKYWWEAVWVAQTVLMTAISVFHHSIGAYHALLCMCLPLLLSAALQQLQQPYVNKQLHRLHLTATGCLLFSTWLTLNMFDMQNYAVHTALGVIMVAVDAVFVMLCVVRIARLAHSTMAPVVGRMAAWLRRVMGVA